MPDITLSNESMDGEVLDRLFSEAKTAYSFADTPVPEDVLRRIWDLTRWAPTSANTQPARVLFVQTPEARARLVEHMGGNNKERTAAAPAVAVIALDSRFHEHAPTVIPHLAHLATTLEDDVEARLRMASVNAAMQAAYFILAARALGLAVGPMGGFDREAVDAEFFPEGRWKSQLVINLGYPTANSFRPRNPRLPVEDVVRFI